MTDAAFTCCVCGRDLSALVLSKRVQHIKRCSSVSGPVEIRHTTHSWLKSLELEQYADAFTREEVALEYIYTLTEEELKTLGVRDSGDQKVIMEAAHSFQRSIARSTLLPLQPLENYRSPLLQPPGSGGSSFATKYASSDSFAQLKGPGTASGAQTKQLTVAWSAAGPNDKKLAVKGDSCTLTLGPPAAAPKSGIPLVTLRDLAAARGRKHVVLNSAAYVSAGCSKQQERCLLDLLYPPNSSTKVTTISPAEPVDFMASAPSEECPKGCKRISRQDSLWTHSACCHPPPLTFESRYLKRQAAALAKKNAREAQLKVAAQQVQTDNHPLATAEAVGLMDESTLSDAPHRGPQHLRSLAAVQAAALREELKAAETVVLELRSMLDAAERTAGIARSI